MFKSNFSKNYLNIKRYKYLNFIDFYQKEYLPKMYLLRRSNIPFNEQYETKDMKLKNNIYYNKEKDENTTNNIKIIKNNMNNRKIPYYEQYESRDFGKQKDFVKQKFIDNDKLIDIIKKHI